jgi:phospholipase C
MMENRSFDHMLGSLKAIYPAMEGIDTAAPGRNQDENGNAYDQRPDALFQLPYGVDPKHEFIDVRDQLAGNCQGFIKNFLRNYPQQASHAGQVMAYFDHAGANRLTVLHTLAENFTICDHWFSSVPGPTWPNRFFVHSGSSNGWVTMPTGIFSHWHTYDQTTLYDCLNEVNRSWRIYFDDFQQSLMLTHQKRPENAARYHLMRQFYNDASGPEADFPEFAFIEPCYFGGYENDQHPPSNVLEGELLIAHVYNALRANQALWESSLFVLLYDEHGGFYDHVYPATPATPPDNLQGDGFDFTHYGPRVPALLISPYAPKNFISTMFDHTSLLKYLTEKWQLSPSLGARTAAANSFGSALLSVARTDTPDRIPDPDTDPHRLAPAAPAPLILAAQPVPNDLQRNLLAFSETLEPEIKDSSDAKVSRHERAIETLDGQVAVAKERGQLFIAQKRRESRDTAALA